MSAQGPPTQAGRSDAAEPPPAGPGNSSHLADHLRLALDAARMGTWRWDPVAGVVEWSPTLERIYGFEPGTFPRTFEAYAERIHPDHRDEALQRIAEAGERGAAFEYCYPIVRPDGAIRWLEGAGRAVTDREGRLVAMAGVCTDATERVEARHRAEAELLVSRMLAEDAAPPPETIAKVLEAVSRALAWDVVTLWLVGDDGRLACEHVWTGPALGRSAVAELSSTLRFERDDGVPGRVWATGRPLAVDVADARAGGLLLRAEAFRRDGIGTLLASPITVAGQVVGVLECASRHRRDAAEVLETLGTLASQFGQFLGRLQAEARTQATLARLERHSHQLTRLAEVATVIGGIVEADDALTYITDQARDIIGAHLAVTSLTRGPDWSQAINRVSLSRRYSEWADYEASPDGSGIYAWVCETQRPVRLTQAELEAHPRWRGFGAARGEHPPLRGWLAAPLTAPDGTNLGLIQLSDKDGGEFTAEDEALLVQLAQIASSAMHKTLLYEERARVAGILQQSLLPPHLPDIPGLEVAARYHAGTEIVGGDFYDVFPVGPHSWAVSIGDICGKGPEAATLTALARHTVRTIAMLDSSPAHVMSVLNASLIAGQPSEDEARFCTAGVVMLRAPQFPGEVVDARVGLAGHPPLLVVRASGDVELVDPTGPLLGLFAGADYRERELRLGPGDLLVLYTDGVIEARRRREVYGEDRLEALVRSLAGAPAAEIADRVVSSVEAFGDGAERDDLAVVVLRITGTAEEPALEREPAIAAPVAVHVRP